MKVYKNIPPPDISRRGEVPNALRLLQIGDSVLFDMDYEKHIHTNAKRLGIKCTTKREGDNIRAWRIA